MAYKVTYIENERVILTTYSDSVTDKDMADSFHDRINKNVGINHYRFLLSDYTDVSDFKVTADGIKQNAKNVIDVSSKLSQIIFIAVVPTDLEFGMGRMWQAYADYDTGWTTYLVRTMEEAEEKIKSHNEQSK